MVHLGEWCEQLALHGLGDVALFVVEPGVVHHQGHPSADVGQYGGLGVGVRGAGAGDGEQAVRPLPGAQRHHDRVFTAEPFEQRPVGGGEGRVRGVAQPGGGQPGGVVAVQRPGHRQPGLLRQRGQGALQPAGTAVVRAAHGDPLQGGGVLGAHVDRGPFAHLGDEQPQQPPHAARGAHARHQHRGDVGDQVQPGGERLQRGGVRGRLLGGAAVQAEVVEDEHHPGPAAVQPQRGGGPDDRHGGAVGAQEVLLAALLGRLRAAQRIGHRALFARDRAAVGLAVQQVVRIPADHLRRGAAEQFLGPGIGGGDPSARVHRDHSGAQVVQHGPREVRVRSTAGAAHGPSPPFRPCPNHHRFPMGPV